MDLGEASFRWEKSPLKKKRRHILHLSLEHTHTHTQNERGKRRQIRNGLDDSTIVGCFPVQRNERKVCFPACGAMLLLLAVVAVVYVWAFGVVCRLLRLRLL